MRRIFPLLLTPLLFLASCAQEPPPPAPQKPIPALTADQQAQLAEARDFRHSFDDGPLYALLASAVTWPRDAFGGAVPLTVNEEVNPVTKERTPVLALLDKPEAHRGEATLIEGMLIAKDQGVPNNVGGLLSRPEPQWGSTLSWWVIRLGRSERDPQVMVFFPADGRPLPEARLKLSLGAGLAGLAAILLQITLFGLTDYRATADVAVVYGARAFPDGHCSDALADRVEAGAALYRQGLVPRLLMSGGPVAGAKPGDAAQNEPEAMKRLAMRLGVPESAILLDPLGVSTVATAQNTAALAREHGWRRILIVSHFYHLSRSKLTMQRAGVGRLAQVRSVPASMRGRVLARLPYYLLREIGAFAKDWLAPKRAEPAA